MKNYDNIYPSQKEMILKGGQIVFDNQRNNSLEGHLVTIDNYGDEPISVQSVIQQHTNPLNEDKEDRKLLVPSATLIHRGSMVKWGTEQWFVMNEVTPNDDNGIYISAKIIKTNNFLKFILPSDHSKIPEIPCITSNMSLYSEGISENKYFILEDGKKFVTIPYNSQTKEIYVGQRFYFWDDKVFMITEIYADKVINGVGVLEIKMQQKDKLITDNVNNSGLADNSITPTPTPVPTVGYSMIITGSDSIIEGNTEPYTAEIYKDNVKVTDGSMSVVWSLLNETGDAPLDTTIATLGNITGAGCEIKGLVMDKYGTLKAVLSIEGQSDIICNKELRFVGGW